MPQLLLSDTLSEFIRRSGYSIGQVARLSGVPRRSVANWTSGRSRKPRHVTDVLRMAQVIRLTGAELDVLLESADMGTTLTTLLASSSRDDNLQELLEPWRNEPVAEPAAVPTPEVRVPFQAIRALPYFVGREDEINELAERLRQPRNATCVIQGMGGVGKSSIAAQLAYLLRDEFPDGVLWAKVDGTNTMATLHSFAAAFGREVSNYSDVQTRSRVVREILADKRVLMVLDDAVDDEALDALLPPTTERCGVIVTTRRTDLSSMLGAFWYRVQPFGVEKSETLALFGEILGSPRVLAERPVFEELSELLGHLPLAIAIAAGRLVSDPLTSAEQLLAQLRDGESRVSELSYGKDSLTLSFDLSFDWLSAEDQSLYTSLGVFSNDDIVVEAVALVNDISVPQASEILQKLYRLSMVQAGGEGRFKLHPLAYDYANARSNNDEALITRMIEAMLEHLEAKQRNYLYIDTILNQVQRALHQAEALSLDDLFLRGVHGLFPYMSETGQLDLADTYLEKAGTIALFSMGDEDEARTIWASGVVAQKRGESEQALKLLNEALDIIRSEAPSSLRCDIHASLGQSLIQAGELEKAVKSLQAGVDDANAVDYQEGACYILIRLAEVERNRSDYAAGEQYVKQGMRIARKLGRKDLQSLAMTCNGIIAIMRGNYERGEKLFLESLKIAEELGMLEKSCGYMMNLGTLYKSQGRITESRTMTERALAIAREIGHRELQSYVLLTLGQVVSSAGDLRKATEHLEEGYKITTVIQNSGAQMSLIWQLGAVYRDQGMYERAERILLEGIDTCRTAGFIYEMAQQMMELSELYRLQGDVEKAISIASDALAQAREAGLPVEACGLMTRLSLIHIGLSDFVTARGFLEESAEIADTVDDPSLLGNVHLAFGELALAEGEPTRSVEKFKAAHELGDTQSHYFISAAALFGLARAYVELGEVDRGLDFGRNSLTQLASSGFAFASEVETWLASVPEFASKSSDGTTNNISS